MVGLTRAKASAFDLLDEPRLKYGSCRNSISRYSWSALSETRRDASKPSPEYLQDWGGLQGTAGDSRGLGIGTWQRIDGENQRKSRAIVLSNTDAGSIPAASTTPRHKPSASKLLTRFVPTSIILR